MLALFNSYNFNAQTIDNCTTVSSTGAADYDTDRMCDLYDLDDDNDGILDNIECGYPEVLVNGSFEFNKLVGPNKWGLFHESKVQGWYSSLGHKKIELWGKNFLGTVAPEGDIVAELMSTAPSTLYQFITVSPGDQILWSLSHKGRSKTEKASIKIGEDLATATVQTIMETDKTAWKRYVGLYTVPLGQTTTVFAIQSVFPAAGSVGNLIDDVRIFNLTEINNCPDFDNDGKPNYLDLDSDNDGIYDVVEAGGIDNNDDGRADDDDNNASNEYHGIPSSAGTGIDPIDTLSNGSFDFLNLDSDEDGCSDADEAYNDPDADGNDTGVYGVDPATVDGFGLVDGAPYTDPIELTDPRLTVIKKVLDKNGVDITGGSVLPGDEIYYELIIENQGIEDITNATITDILSSNIEFTAGATIPDPGLNLTYNGTNEVTITIEDEYVERFDSALSIRFKVTVEASCIDLRDACADQIINTATTTYTGVSSSITITNEDSILGQDACLFDDPGAATVLIDVSGCDNKYDAILCTGTLDLVAGSGFPTYRWTNLSSGNVVGTSQTLNVSTGGEYRVDKTGDPNCSDAFEIWTVKAFNTVVNPIIDIVNNTSVNGNIRTCPITAEALPEIFLCGIDAEEYLDSGFADATNIIWERLDPSSCPTVIRNESCPTLDSGCSSDWVQVANTREYTVSQPGEYRIRAEFDVNCSIDFYFNVFKNNFAPSLKIVQDIVCTTPGTLRVQNSSNQYEYQLITPVTNTVVGYQISPEFAGLTEEGTYTINVRQNNGLSTACVFQATQFMEISESIVSITTTDPGCPNDKGEVVINVTDSGPNYSYTIASTTNTFSNAVGPTTTTNHIFSGLNPDTYTVEVVSFDGSCIDSKTITIDSSIDFSAVTTLRKDLSCNTFYQPDSGLPDYDPDQFTAIADINITGGTGPFEYSTNITMTPLLTVPSGSTNEIRFTTDGVYPIFVRDTSTGCVISAGSVTVSEYSEVVATATAIDPICTTEKGSIFVEITDGEGPFTYVLNSSTFVGPINTPNHTFVNLSSGNHSIIIFDRFNCITSLNATITDAIEITADIAITQNYQCDALGTSVQTATISVTNPQNGNSSYEYSIDGIDYTNTTGIFTGLTAGTYTVFIRDTDTNFCPVELGSLTVDPLKEIIDLDFNASQPQCPALTADVELIPTTTNTPATIEYRITSPTVTAWQNSSEFAGLSPGTTYTFEARTTEDGCIYSETYTIEQVDAIIINTTLLAEPQCHGDENAAFSFEVSGIDLTSTSYSYTVTGGSLGSPNIGGSNTTPITISGLGSGVYTILVTDTTTNCNESAMVTINQPNAIAIDAIDSTPLTCIQDAVISVTSSGGSGGIQYELLNSSASSVAGPQTSPTFTVGTADTYTIVVSDRLNCTTTDTVIITDPPAISASFDSGSDLCYTPANPAQLDVTITGGTAPFTYTINSGASTNVTGNTFSVTSLTPNTYTVTILDTYGCKAKITQTIAPQLTASASLTKDIDCSASTAAEISITTNGGTAPIRFETSLNGGTYTSISGSSYTTGTSGTYAFKAIDANNCEVITNEIIVSPAANPEATAVATSPTCPLASDGGATITVNNSIGVPPYEIDFNGNGYTNQTVYGGLTAGTYSYTIRDANQCESAILTIDVNDPAPISVTTFNQNNITCDAVLGTTNGSIEAVGVLGGTGTYTYTLRKPDNSLATVAGGINPITATTSDTALFEDLEFGNYTLEITDSNSCAFTYDFRIITKPLFTITESAPVATCLGGVTVDISVFDGVGPFQIREYPSGTFANLNGDPTSSGTTFERNHQFTNLAFDTPFTYEIIDIDSNCTDIRTITPQPSPSSITITKTENNTTCNTVIDGSLDYIIDGYNGNELTYQLYSLIDVNTDISASYTFSNGVNQTGLSGSSATGTISLLPPGKYLLRVNETDSGLAAPCNAAIEFEITEPELLELRLDSQKDGFCTKRPEVVMIATGGTGPYTYIANDGTTDVASNANGIFNTLTGTSYTIRVEDDNGCSSLGIPVTLNTIASPSLTAIPAYDQCTFGSAYTFTVNATGTGQLSYSIDGVSFIDDGANHDFTITSTGSYTVTVRDTRGCTDTQTIDIFEDLQITADFNTEPTCSSGEDIIVTVNGGSDFLINPSNFDFTLSGTDINTNPVLVTQTGNNTFTGILAGQYNIQVTDNGATATACSANTNVNRVYTQPIVTLKDSGNVTCNLGNDGFILVELSTGTNIDNPFTYQLFDFSGGTQGLQVGTDQIDNPLFENISEGEYRVIVTSTFGCQNMLDPISISEPGILSATATPTNYSCNASNDKIFPSIEVTISGGTSPYKITYTGPLSGTDIAVTGSSFTIDSYMSGGYNISITDFNNCSFSLTSPVNIQIPEMSAPVVAQNSTISCVTPQEDVTVTITGGTGPFDFSEINAAVATKTIASGGATTSASFSLLAPGNYIFEIYDQGTGCSIRTDSYSVATYDTIGSSIDSGTNISCFNTSPQDGTVELTVTGHNGTYNYSAENLNTTTIVTGSGNTTTMNPITITDLEPGTIEVTVTDPVTGCTAISNTYTIISPPVLELTVNTIISGYCDSNDNAVIEASGRGGTGTLTYRLENATGTPLPPYDTFGTTTLFENLSHSISGTTYQIRVQDSEGCEEVESLTLTSPDPITIASAPGSTLDCIDSQDGVITVTATGGQGIGSYLFVLTYPDGSQGSEVSSATDAYSFTNLPAGNYSVTVFDNLNCSASQNVIIDTLPETTITINTTRTPTCANPTADVMVTGSGGTAPYEYSNDGVTYVSGANPYTFNNLTPGDYTFFVKDAAGCESIGSNTVTISTIENVNITLDTDNTSIVCFDENTASIDGVVTGGLGNYMYSLTGTTEQGNPVSIPAQSSSFFGDLYAGSYTYSVTSEDCGPETRTFTITQPDAALTATEIHTDISCNGNIDGTITITLSGGTPDYNYTLYDNTGAILFRFIEDDSDGILGEHTFDELFAGIYSVEISDTKGCVIRIEDITINEPVAITANIISITPESCAGYSNGEAVVSISGGTIGPDPLNPVYYWSLTGVDSSFQLVSDPTNLVLQDLPGGITTLFIRDYSNNEDCTLPINLDVDPGVILDATLEETADCAIIDFETGEILKEAIQYINFVPTTNSATTDIIYTITGVNGTPDPSNNFNMDGTFVVTPGEYMGTMTSSNGCEVNIGTILIEEYTNILSPSVQLTGSTADVNEYEIILDGAATNPVAGYTYFLTFIDESDVEIQLESNRFVIRKTGDYMIRVINETGCEAQLTKKLTYINLIIPNYYDATDPNGWYPDQVSENEDDPFYFSSLEVKIFDRYGRLLSELQGDQRNNGWQGILKGKDLPSGDYWYLILLNDAENTEFVGHFTLHR
ncbi:T9SS type B sorting domain-containing protein [Aquimarina pacifica]|uniref:T9SS type B sorting domain-containing protein n=1 Tax=Aquimarina pacifica TaxID=1296415 RepID=UPI00047046F3|nr:T9SS type B sorting domain-containing protein [Aquimarina pacifica]